MSLVASLVAALLLAAPSPNAADDTAPQATALEGAGPVQPEAPPPAVPPPPSLSYPIPAPAPAGVPPPPSLSIPIPPRPTPPPASASDDLFEAGLRSAFIAAEARQGPLNGAWVVSSQDGAALYRFQIVDAGLAYIPEGAWSDARAGGGPDAHGFLNTVARNAAGVTMSFVRTDGSLTALTLTARAAGSYAGELTTPAGVQPVVMTRP